MIKFLILGTMIAATMAGCTPLTPEQHYQLEAALDHAGQGGLHRDAEFAKADMSANGFLNGRQ